MDPIIIQNQLSKARREGKSPTDTAKDTAKEMLKKEVKRQIWLWLLPILASILPWLLVIFIFFFVWYAGCTNMGGTLKGFGLSILLKGMGICVF